MVKKRKEHDTENTVFWLIVCAILIELGNVVVTWMLGAAQKDVCPKSNFPGDLSIFLGIASLIPIIVVLVIAKNKILATALVLFWVVLVFGAGYILQFVAVGGLNWCGFLGR